MSRGEAPSKKWRSHFFDTLWRVVVTRLFFVAFVYRMFYNKNKYRL